MIFVNISEFTYERSKNLGVLEKKDHRIRDKQVKIYQKSEINLLDLE